MPKQVWLLLLVRSCSFIYITHKLDKIEKIKKSDFFGI
jgi:hypothetical protein